MAEDCILGVKNEQRIKNVEDDMSEVKSSIIEIRDKLLGRPSWVVLFIFTGMSSFIVALTSALIFMLSGR